MLDISVRLLRLLSLLQVRRDWSGADLVGRLGVTNRTVRNDIERLRILGYAVHSGTGITGSGCVAFEVLDPPELRALLRELADRYAAAACEPARDRGPAPVVAAGSDEVMTGDPSGR
jgi:predicted DNA-binding transcriptional regulator YafY